MAMAKVISIGIGLTVLFLLLANLVMPFYNTAGDINTTGGGVQVMTTATYRGILLLVFFLAIIGIALSFWKKS